MTSVCPSTARLISRAGFIRGLAATVTSLGLLRPTQAKPTNTTTEIAPGIFVHGGTHSLANPENGGDICNCGFVVGQSAVAVIDTGGSAKIGTALKSAISKQTQVPIRYVINTHMHPDHVLGNAAFEADGVAFAAHHKMLRSLAERTETYLEAAKEHLGDEAFMGTRVVLPSLLVENSKTIDLGGRQLTLTAHPTAHTNNDLTIRDSTTDTLFLGDLLFAEHIPTIDGSLRGWLKLLDALMAEKAARIVPGHGPASMEWPGAATDLKRYLDVLAKDVRACIAAGKTMTEAIETAGQSERGKWQVFNEHHARNVSASFAELEWE